MRISDPRAGRWMHWGGLVGLVRGSEGGQRPPDEPISCIRRASSMSPASYPFWPRGRPAGRLGPNDRRSFRAQASKRGVLIPQWVAMRQNASSNRNPCEYHPINGVASTRS